MAKSSKPGKQRKAQANAPLHVKRKRVRARLQLDKPDERLAGLRSVTIRVGDTVRVVRGDFAHGGKRVGGKRNADPLTGKVINVESNTGRIFVEGATATKSDNRRGCSGPCLKRRRHKVGRDGQVANAKFDRR